MSTDDPDFPPVLFVHQASVDEGDDFFDRLWPEARAVSDTKKKLYRAFGLKRGGIGEVLGPKVWARGLAATLGGNRVGKPVGDPMQMPGSYLIDPEGEILWSHVAEHAGDNADLDAVPRRQAAG